MRSLVDMDVIQIEITNACVNQCANCTRLVGHTEKPFFMSLDFFKKAVDSLVDYPKMVGIMGGEPLLHPQFEEMAVYLKEKIPDRIRCGLWSTLPPGKKKYASLIADVFGNVLLNDHTHPELYHHPVLVAARETGLDDFSQWYLIDKCPVQNVWSGSITPKGAFFCEVAAALDMVFQGPGGWQVEPGWWKKTPRDFVGQMNAVCPRCGVALPLFPRLDTEQVDDVSPGNLEALKRLGSPKIRKGLYQLYNKGIRPKNHPMNKFREDTSYAQKVARKYGLELKTNAIGYLEPFLTNNSK